MTRDISRKGVHFFTQEKINAKGFVSLSIEWPVLHQGQNPLQLRVSGKIVRCDDAGVAVIATRHNLLPRSGETGESEMMPGNAGVPETGIGQAVQS